MGHKGKLLFRFAGLQVSVPNPNSHCTPYASTCPYKLVFKDFLIYFFYLCIFTDKESLNGIILPIIWFLKYFLLSETYTQFISTVST